MKGIAKKSGVEYLGEHGHLRVTREGQPVTLIRRQDVEHFLAEGIIDDPSGQIKKKKKPGPITTDKVFGGEPEELPAEEPKKEPTLKELAPKGSLVMVGEKGGEVIAHAKGKLKVRLDGEDTPILLDLDEVEVMH